VSRELELPFSGEDIKFINLPPRFYFDVPGAFPALSFDAMIKFLLMRTENNTPVT